MSNVIDFKPDTMRADMLDILERTIERVKSGEVTGLVVCGTRDDGVTYNSAAGVCCSMTMIGLLTAATAQLVDCANAISEDVLE